MGLKFTCNICGTEIVVKFLRIGEVARCRQCGGNIKVPETAIETEEKPTWQIDSHRLEPESMKGVNLIGPKTVGELLSNCFSLYFRNFSPLLILSAIFYLPFLAFGYWCDNHLPAIVGGEELNLFSSLAIFSLFTISTILYILISYPLFIGSTIHIVISSLVERPPRIFPALRISLGRFVYLLGAMIIAFIVTFAFFITLIGIPIALYLAVAWSFIVQSVVLERQEIIASLKRSHHLVKDNWWRTFGSFLLMGIIQMTIQFPFSLAGVVVSSVMEIALMPLLTVFGVLLYLDLRARKEGYNIEMLRKDLEALDIAEGETPAPAPNTGPTQNV